MPRVPYGDGDACAEAHASLAATQADMQNLEERYIVEREALSQDEEDTWALEEYEGRLVQFHAERTIEEEYEEMLVQFPAERTILIPVERVVEKLVEVSVQTIVEVPCSAPGPEQGKPVSPDTDPTPSAELAVGRRARARQNRRAPEMAANEETTLGDLNHPAYKGTMTQI